MTDPSKFNYRKESLTTIESDDVTRDNHSDEYDILRKTNLSSRISSLSYARKCQCRRSTQYILIQKQLSGFRSERVSTRKCNLHVTCT